jgi:hypothetical protein
VNCRRSLDVASAGRFTVEKVREVTASVLDAATNFWNRIGREPIENSFDLISIDLSMNAREVTEANGRHAASR